MIYKNVQALRALAANGVLLSHILSVETKYGHGFSFLPGDVHLGSLGVDLFFVISGFIMATIGATASWDKFLIGRVTRIYPPYWFYTTIIFIVSLVVPSMVNSSFDHAPSLWRSYLLFPDSVMPLLAVGWTLIHEIYFYIVFAGILLTSQFIKLPMLVWVLVWGAAIIIANHSGALNGQDPVMAVITHPLTLEFILGIMVGILIRQPKLIQILSVICAIFAYICIYYISRPPTMNIDIKDTLHVGLFGIPCALLIYLALQMEIKQRFTATPLLIELGNASYSTYLAHVLVISAIGRVFAAMPFHSYVFEAAFVVICIMGANITGLLSYRYIEQPIQHTLRKRLAAKKA